LGSTSGRLNRGSRQSLFPRNHWALLLCRVMSAKSKSPRLARKTAAKSSAKLTQHQSTLPTAGSPDRVAELFAHGVALFNTRYFFEAHEAWEEIWLHTEPPEKIFLQGLIQVTAAFHHHSRNNLRGTKSLLRAGLMKLEDFPPHHRGLHVEKLRIVARKWLVALDQGEQNRWPVLPRIAPAPNRQ
jgi:uncharacterized protein